MLKFLFSFVRVVHLNYLVSFLWGLLEDKPDNDCLLNAYTLNVSFADRSIRPLFPVGYFYDTQVGRADCP